MEKFPEAHAQIHKQVSVGSPIRLDSIDLERVHTRTYLDSVNLDSEMITSGAGLTRYARNRLGLPAHPRLLSRSSLETAGTVSATLAALNLGMAANLAGGTHHAFPDRGLGFCVLNDVAVAVEYLRAHDQLPDQILIVDTDAHQGNANHAFFRGDRSVFTYSIHVGKNYPAAKEPGDLDVALPRYVCGEDYLDALRNTMPGVFAKTEPDLVFWISGADVHVDDRFGQMSLNCKQIAERDRYVLALCQDFAAKLVVLYGGGYNRTPGKTGWLHAQTILRVAEAFRQSQNHFRI
jgi:acetoin utilization deacetylase AcuC-like enzyme